jgi:hypothetical protein
MFETVDIESAVQLLALWTEREIEALACKMVAVSMVSIPSNFADQNTEALKTIALIDAELQRR